MYIDWDDFTPQEFLEWFKEKITKNITWLSDRLYNVSTWLEEMISRK